MKKKEGQKAIKSSTDVFKSEYFFIQFPFDKIKYKCILIKIFKHIQRFIYGTDKIYILFLNNNYFR